MFVIDYEKLIELITNKVIEKINQQKYDVKNKNAIVINGKTDDIAEKLECHFNHYNIYHFDNEDCIPVEKADIVIISSLDVGQVGRLTQGMSINCIDELILNAFYSCKKVYVLEKGQCDNPAFDIIMKKNYEILEQCGLTFVSVETAEKVNPVIECEKVTSNKPAEAKVLSTNELDYTDRKVLVGKDIEDLQENTVLIINKPVITPSAKDLIKTKRICLNVV